MSQNGSYKSPGRGSKSTSKSASLSAPNPTNAQEILDSSGVTAAPSTSGRPSDIPPIVIHSGNLQGQQHESNSVASTLGSKKITQEDDEEMQEKKDRVVVTDYVKLKLWPKLKFITDKDTQLAFTTNTRSICHMVTDGCNMTKSKELKNWWVTARKWVLEEIRRLKGDRSEAIKWEYFGKLYLCLPV